MKDTTSVTEPATAMTKNRKLALTAAIVIFVVMVVGQAVGPMLDWLTPKRNRYLIPAGYKGWLCISYFVPSAGTLPVEDGFRLVHFGANGIVETSERGKGGKLKDEFFWISNGVRTSLDVGAEVGGGSTVGDAIVPGRYTFMFWVSKNAKSEQPDYNPGAPAKCGPA